jgi:hypothetical protein
MRFRQGTLGTDAYVRTAACITKPSAMQVIEMQVIEEMVRVT